MLACLLLTRADTTYSLLLGALSTLVVPSFGRPFLFSHVLHVTMKVARSIETRREDVTSGARGRVWF